MRVTLTSFGSWGKSKATNQDKMLRRAKKQQGWGREGEAAGVRSCPSTELKTQDQGSGKRATLT